MLHLQLTSLPMLHLQLTSSPVLVLFHLPSGLAKAVAGWHSPKVQLWVLLQAAALQSYCSPPLKGSREPRPACACASAQGSHIQQQWCCSDPQQGLCVLCLPPLVSSPLSFSQPTPCTLLFSWISLSFSSSSFYSLLLLGPNFIRPVVTTLEIYISQHSSTR